MSLLHTLLAVLATILWGFTFVAIKAGLGEFPPLLFAALRFMVVAIPAMIFVPRHGIPWRWIIAVGLTMGTFVLLGDPLSRVEILGASFVFVGLCLTVLTPAKPKKMESSVPAKDLQV